jgi:hypothetical protein
VGASRGWRWWLWPRVLVALVLCVSVLGCAGTGERGGADDAGLRSDREAGAPDADPGRQSGGAPGAPDANLEQQSGGVPGAPGSPGGQGNGAQAIGAPIKMPAFTQIGGQPVDQVRPQIEDAIRAACTPRHDLCVTTVVKPREGADAHACFAGTDPPTKEAGTELARDTLLTIYSAPGGCGVPDPSADPQSTDGTEPPEVTQPDETVPPGDSQPPPPSSS